ncbi:alpha/beta fold hydrolase [Pseudomonas sp. 250J]|uniref:alpha/beta fold hydrolase n=1 Tax=Pseudomonas sp. 250J TaxID=1478142 RepID=UPI00210A695D|nr:alpha/beta fold hydrolase [Pseudomonas sp. 250J]
MDTPVVMVNGLIGCLDHPTFQRTLRPRKVFAPDLLGYGSLDDTPSTLVDIDAQVEHLRRILLARNLPYVHLLGHSVGGGGGDAVCPALSGQCGERDQCRGQFHLEGCVLVGVGGAYGPKRGRGIAARLS